MTELQKATLQRLTTGPRPQPDGDPVPVQFNPTTLRLSLSNQVEGGASQGRQERHFNGKSSTDVSFDLVFDTADEANAGAPRSVRQRTALVEQFVVPTPDPNDPSQRLVPPRVRFQWGDLSVDGIISSLQIDFDHFAEDGTPLRAKISVAIKEQDSRYVVQVAQTASGAPAAPSAGARGAAAPGMMGGISASLDASFSASFSAQAGIALGGESLADFSARMGMEADAWRGLAGGLDSTLSLEAGMEIDFDASVSAQLGLGSEIAFSAGAQVSVEGALGLEVSASAGVNASLEAGFALSAAGGAVAAIEIAATASANAAASAAKAAFGIATSGGANGPSIAAIARAATVPGPTSRSALPATAAEAAPLARAGTSASNATLPPAPRPPRADPRARSFGRGVPLARRRDPEIAAPPGTSRHLASIGPAERRARTDKPLPGDAPWIALPVQSAGRTASAKKSHERGCACCRPKRGRKS